MSRFGSSPRYKSRPKIALLLITFLSAGCAEAVDPDAVTGANDHQIADPVESPVTDGRSAVAGRWSRGTIDGTPTITYSWGVSPQVVFSCDGRQGINVELRGQTPIPPQEMIRLTTAGETGLYAARSFSDQGMVRASITAPDDMIEALMQGQPIRIAFGEDELITAAASPLVPPFVNQCRTN